MDTNQQSQFSNGFDHGNYCNAYETEDFEIAGRCLKGKSEYFVAGFVLGFYSSYEIHEVPSGLMQDTVTYYRKLFAKTLGDE